MYKGSGVEGPCPPNFGIAKMAPTAVVPTRNTYINILNFGPSIFSDMLWTLVNKRNPEILHK